MLPSAPLLVRQEVEPRWRASVRRNDRSAECGCDTLYTDLCRKCLR